MEVAQQLAAETGAHVDAREGHTPGAKFFHWERRGVPIVFELGPRDVAAGNVVIKRRDTGAKVNHPAGVKPPRNWQQRWMRCRRTCIKKRSSV